MPTFCEVWEICREQKRRRNSIGGTRHGLLQSSLFLSHASSRRISLPRSLSRVFGLVLPAGIIIFPLSYVFGDVLTEVYGYRKARRAIWLGFLCNFIAVAAIWLSQILPPAAFWDGQAAYERILGYTPAASGRIFCRLPGGRVREFSRPRKDEDRHQRAPALDADHRLHGWWVKGSTPSSL